MNIIYIRVLPTVIDVCASFCSMHCLKKFDGEIEKPSIAVTEQKKRSESKTEESDTNTNEGVTPLVWLFFLVSIIMFYMP